jgi:cytochrome oxidase assembly protein ShyY1
LNNFKSKILIFAIIFVPITISLGMWQIERANEKKLIIANYDKLLVSAPIALQKKPNVK